MSTTKIFIEEYSSTWASTFEQLKSVYLTHLADLVTDVQHVGSTAVPGLAAKPIIDIDLIIDNKKNLDAVIEKLHILGYDHVGDLGISNREAFKPQSDQAPFSSNSSTWPKHHLYVCLSGSDSLINHLAFRDFLRSHPEKARAYGELKKRLALEDPHDIDRYVECKTPFITDVLRKVGLNEQSISRIMQDNSMTNLKSKR